MKLVKVQEIRRAKQSPPPQKKYIKNKRKAQISVN